MLFNQTRSLGRIVVSVLPFTILVLYYLAYYPGCFSSDSEAYFKYFDDHHPLFFLLYIRLIKLLTRGFDGYILLNVLFFSFLYARILLFFLKKGVPFLLILALSVVVPLLPSTGLMMVTYWKDIIYALSFCYFVFLLLKLVYALKENVGVRTSYFIELFIASIFLLGTRHNGLVTSIFSFGVLILCVKPYRRQLFIVFFSAFFVKTGVNYTAKHYFGATSGWMTADHLLVRHLSVYLHESKLDDSGKSVLSSVMPIEEFKKGFHYYSHDGYAYGDYADQYRRNVVVNKWAIRKTFFRHLCSHPMVFLRSELRMTQLIWRPVPTPDSFRNTYCTNCKSGVFKDARLFFDFLLQKTTIVGKPYTWVLFWSGSFQVWTLLLLAIIVSFIGSKFSLLPFVPILGNIISLAIGIVSQDLRYIYSEILLVPLFILYLFALMNRKKINCESCSFS